MENTYYTTATVVIGFMATIYVLFAVIVGNIDAYINGVLMVIGSFSLFVLSLIFGA